MGAPVIHFEIMGGEGTQLETFYRELFGWKINSNNPMKYGIVETKGGPGGINGGVGPANDGSRQYHRTSYGTGRKMTHRTYAFRIINER